LPAAFDLDAAMAMPLDEAVTIIANRLVAEQLLEGDIPGTWPEEPNFTGSIVAGMVGAYERTSDSTYRDSAELGGYYILWSAYPNFFYGDEAFALTRLSEISEDPQNNSWRAALVDFYSFVRDAPGGTQDYIASFANTEPSTAVFYIATNVVAAYYVDAADKEIWRQGLVEWLSQVDDTSYFPVMSLGIATWALAKTGPLDETAIDPSGEGAPYWNSKSLADLPTILLSHQVADGEPNAGSFYWQFQHENGSPSGYTEDTIFAVLGLIAASSVDSDPSLESAVLAARGVLLDGIDSEGRVWERLSQEGTTCHAYAGAMLQVLQALHPPGDINMDGLVNLIDFEILVANWNASDCSDPSWCDGADIDRSGDVGAADLEIMLDDLSGDTSN
jgi:hypothetical protein